VNRSKRFGFWSHSKWLLAEHTELIDPVVFLLLVLDVLPDRLLPAPYRRDEVSPGMGLPPYPLSVVAKYSLVLAAAGCFMRPKAEPRTGRLHFQREGR